MRSEGTLRIRRKHCWTCHESQRPACFERTGMAEKLGYSITDGSSSVLQAKQLGVLEGATINFVLAAETRMYLRLFNCCIIGLLKLLRLHDLYIHKPSSCNRKHTCWCRHSYFNSADKLLHSRAKIDSFTKSAECTGDQAVNIRMISKCLARGSYRTLHDVLILIKPLMKTSIDEWCSSPPMVC